MTEKQQTIIRLFPNHSLKEIMEITGCSHNYPYMLAKQYGVKRDEKLIAQKTRDNRQVSLGKRFHPESKRKMIENRQHTVRMERRRIELGLKRKTKLHFSPMPNKVYHAKWQLIHIHGYIETDDLYTLFYDEHTSRRIACNLTPSKQRFCEEYYTKTYGLKFIADYQNDTTGISTAV